MKSTLCLLMLILALAGCKKTQDEPCPVGFKGDNCDQEIPPRRMTVNFVQLDRMPAQDNGQDWDASGSGLPDVFIRIRQGNTIIWESSVKNDIAIGNLPVSWPDVVDISTPEAEHSIEVYDYDSFDDDDFIGGITFTPYPKGLKFPENGTLNCSGCNVDFQLVGITYFH